MKILKIITLLLCLIEPTAIRSNPVKGISDFDGSFKEVERITFECPTNEERKIQRPDEELEDQQPKEAKPLKKKYLLLQYLALCQNFYQTNLRLI